MQVWVDGPMRWMVDQGFSGGKTPVGRARTGWMWSNLLKNPQSGIASPLEFSKK
jgi:hypothetical protein